MFDLLNKVKKLINKDLYKNAEKLYNSGAVLFCRKQDNDKYVFTLKESNNLVNTVELEQIKKIPEDILKRNMTVAELAAYMHYCLNCSITRYKGNKPSALKKELKLDNTEFKEPSAALKIILKNSELHASSSWETCNLSITILYRNKTYVGSNNKLRQLRFDENKSNGLKLQDFSFLDRQIIRFLTQYAESDGTGFSLKSDLMAEFLHCFNEKKVIYVNEHPVSIHTESAQLTGLFKNSEKKLYPGLSVEGKILPLINSSFIMGKCGLWAGYMGEYWWMPIAADILWVRKFLLSGGISVNERAKLISMPFPVIEFSGEDLRFIPCSPIYYVNYSDKGEVLLSVKFKYFEEELSLSNERLGMSAGGFWKRDKLTEEVVVNEVKMLGFKGGTKQEYYSIYDLEQKGLFFDRVLGEWLENSKQIFFSPEAGRLFYNLKPVRFYCNNPKLKNGLWTFDYLFTNETGGKITWNKLLRSIKNNRSYIELDNKLIAGIPKKLADLILSFQGIINIAKGENNSLTISNAALLYLIEIGGEVIEEIPGEWKKKVNNLNNIESKLEDRNLFSFNGILREYQVKAVKWMYDMIQKGFNAVLADEMGLGKTIQALALINILINEKKNNYPIMVVCPTSLVQNWKNEANTFTPELKVGVIFGADRYDVINKINEFDLLITSYALVKRDIDFYKNIKFALLILDEAQHIKNPSTINAKVCKSINTKSKIVLTGTPLENSSEDIWSIFDFLNPGMLGNNESFKRMYAGIETEHEKQKELSERIAPFIMRRHKSEVEQLPEKTEKTIYCELLPSQKKLYDSILRDGKSKYDLFTAGKSTRFDVLSSLTRLRQICCHSALLPELMRKGEILESAKFELLKELLFETLDSGQKTLVFSQFTALLKIISSWLDKEGISYEYLDGATLDRQGRVDRFNKDKNIKLFLLSLKAGGIGLNLTSATNVIIYDPWWNPTAELQAADRIHRIGQKMPVTTYKLVVEDSIEEKILDLQNKKLGLFNGVIEETAGMKKLTDKDLAFLFSSVL